MPKVSKVRVPGATPGSKPGAPSPPKERPEKYYCTRCGKSWKLQKGNFPTSQSPLYKENGGYLSICSACMDDLYNHYKSVLGSGEDAMHRICMKFDIYWHPDIWAMVPKLNSSTSRVRTYISKTNLIRYVTKTYDDTLDEARAAGMSMMPVIKRTPDDEEKEAPEELIDFWGVGFDNEFYYRVQERYDRWTADLPSPLPPSSETLYKQICLTEETINRDTIAGKDTDKAKNTLISLLGALNEKPVQKKQDELDSAFEEMPFGVGIKMCENMRPIPKPLPELEDADHIIRYITIWFLGHLCSMLKIRNTYCKLYEQEIAKLRVDRPELEAEEDEDVFNEIFGGDAV